MSTRLPPSQHHLSAPALPQVRTILASNEALGLVSSASYNIQVQRQPPEVARNQKENYVWNKIVAIFILPPLSLSLWNHASPYPLQTFLYLVLTIYVVDLANLREFYLFSLCIATIIMIVVSAATCLMNIGEDEAANSSSIFITTRILCETLLYICTALWGVLQAHWIHKENSLTAQIVENTLLSVLTPLSISLTMFHLVPFCLDYGSPEQVAKYFPYVFCSILTLSMMSLGSLKYGVGENYDFVVRPGGAKVHMSLLLLVPPMMYMASFYQRLFSKHSIIDVWLDLVLVWFVPYLLLYYVHFLHWNKSIPSPYQMPLLFGHNSYSSFHNAFNPIIISLIASLALEYEYLIPLCRSIAYNFQGHDASDDLIVSFLLTGALLSFLSAFWIYGRNYVDICEPLFGEYQDDIVQVSLALAGLLLGKAVGMPWSLIPLPILALLGTIIWLSTRMLRYLAMLLFVFYSTAMVMWSYRYAGIQTKMEMVWGFEVNLFQFGMLIVGTSLLVFLVLGLAVRSNGGIGHAVLKKFDVCGLSLFLYTVLESSLECILLNAPVPKQDLAGLEVNEHPERIDNLYQPVAAYATSIALAGLCLFLHHRKIISLQKALLSLCLTFGKAVAIFIDIHVKKHSTNKLKIAASNLLFRCLIGAGLLLIVAAPRAFLKPFHLRFSRARKKIPESAYRILVVYGFFLLPLILFVSIPWILQPLDGILSGKFSAYYITAPAMSESLGWACSLWGVAMLLTTNHLLPDDGGDQWKKVSALTFFMGLLIALIAPTIPPWMRYGDAKQFELNPYASLSSQSPLETFSGHAGGWGLLSTALATLLALTGPLNLRERNDKSDRFLLLRTMIFSLLFGCGISCFVTLELMSHEAFLPTFPIAMASIVMSFLGTVGGVLSFSLELKDFEEAEQILKVWIGAFPLFLLTAATAQFVGTTAHPFGVGGWISTYLSVCGIITLALCLIIRARNKRKKNNRTRGVANFFCIFSWMCWISILFGHYGVAGIDADFNLNTFFGIPASLFGTVVISIIFYFLEDERSGGRSGRGSNIKRISRVDHAKQYGNSWMSINFQDLSGLSRLAPQLTAICLILVSASLYSILFRGFFQTTRQHVFESIYNSTYHTDDLATLAKKNLQHRDVVQMTARLFRISFWTTPNIFTPTLFLLGVFSTIPSIYGLISYLWLTKSELSIASGIGVPLNLIPIIFCRELPPLFAAAIIGFLGGLYHAWLIWGEQQQLKMRI